MTRRLLAAACLATTAGIHLWLAPDHMAASPAAAGHGHGQATYVGWLFLFGGFLAAGLAAAVACWDWPPHWHLAAALCAAMAIALVLARTTGLPGGFHEHTWQPAALWSLAVEVGFLGLYAGRVRVVRRRPAVPIGAR
jgi:hypothetical protein